MGSSFTTSNMFKENKINVNDTLVELESVDKGEGILSWNFDTNETETTIVTEKKIHVAEESEVFYLYCGENSISLTAYHIIPVYIDGGEKQEIAISELEDIEYESIDLVSVNGIEAGSVRKASSLTDSTEVVTIKTEAGYYFSNNILICD